MMIGSFFRLFTVRSGSVVGMFRSFEANSIRSSCRHITINIQITTEGPSGTNVTTNVPESVTRKYSETKSDNFEVNCLMTKQAAERLSGGPPATLKALGTADTSDVLGTDLNRLINSIIEKKMRSSSSSEYRTLKMMGDSFLRTLTYQYLYEKGSRANMLFNSDIILMNGVDCAMPKFFDKYIKDIHAGMVPNEELSPHGKCDFVEALIECARSESSTSPTLIFILSKLFDSYR
jgi:hypothetical protein